VKQLLAIVGAVVMVLGALWVHGDFDGAGGGDGDRETTRRLLCATELLDACADIASDTGIEIIEEPSGGTRDALSTLPDADRASLDYDGWLTFSRDADIVREARERNQLGPVLDEPGDSLGRSPLVLAIWDDRAAALADRCGGELTWKCLGDVAGLRWASIGGESAWGDVKPGHADPATTAEGLAVIGQAASQYFGTSDLSSADYEDDGFLDWFTQLERAVPAGGGVGDSSPLEVMLAAGPATFDVVATTEAEAGPLLASVARDTRDSVTLLYRAPVASVDVVYVPVVDRGSDVSDAVGDAAPGALARAGFRVDGEGSVPGVRDRPALPDRSNLPDSGPLFALLQTWRQVTG